MRVKVNGKKERKKESRKGGTETTKKRANPFYLFAYHQKPVRMHFRVRHTNTIILLRLVCVACITFYPRWVSWFWTNKRPTERKLKNIYIHTEWIQIQRKWRKRHTDKERERQREREKGKKRDRKLRHGLGYAWLLYAVARNTKRAKSWEWGKEDSILSG